MPTAVQRYPINWCALTRSSEIPSKELRCALAVPVRTDASPLRDERKRTKRDAVGASASHGIKSHSKFRSWSSVVGE
jgi:hypothetical protein